MPDAWYSLTPEQRNALVATEVMGWPSFRVGETATAWPMLRLGPVGDAWYPILRRDCTSFGEPYRPTSNIAQAWEVQEQMSMLGLSGPWATKLGELLRIEHDITYLCETVWLAATAIADQRCHAAVLAVEA